MATKAQLQKIQDIEAAVSAIKQSDMSKVTLKDVVEMSGIEEQTKIYNLIRVLKSNDEFDLLNRIRLSLSEIGVSVTPLDEFFESLSISRVKEKKKTIETIEIDDRESEDLDLTRETLSDLSKDRASAKEIPFDSSNVAPLYEPAVPAYIMSQEDLEARKQKAWLDVVQALAPLSKASREIVLSSVSVYYGVD